MTPHRRLVTAAARYRLKSDYHTARLAGALAGPVRQTLAAVLADLPDKPHPLDAYRLADLAAARVRGLGHALRGRLRGGLEQLAGYGHAHAARLLTRRVRGTLPVRAVRREAVAASRVTEAWTDYLDDYDGWVIDPPAADLIARLVGPAPDTLTRLLDPQRASRVVIDGIARGADRRTIAAELADVFGGYEAAARRVARTEGGRISTEVQLAASEQIADLIPAYQVLAVLDRNTREDHRKRSGTIYYRQPSRGQLGLDHMPRPPLDWTPGGWVTAFNCRCVIVPCWLADDDAGELAAAGALVYDRQTGHVR